MDIHIPARVLSAYRCQEFRAVEMLRLAAQHLARWCLSCRRVLFSSSDILPPEQQAALEPVAEQSPGQEAGRFRDCHLTDLDLLVLRSDGSLEALISKTLAHLTHFCRHCRKQWCGNAAESLAEPATPLVPGSRTSSEARRRKLVAMPARTRFRASTLEAFAQPGVALRLLRVGENHLRRSNNEEARRNLELIPDLLVHLDQADSAAFDFVLPLSHALLARARLSRCQSSGPCSCFEQAADSVQAARHAVFHRGVIHLPTYLELDAAQADLLDRRDQGTLAQYLRHRAALFARMAD